LQDLDFSKIGQLSQIDINILVTHAFHLLCAKTWSIRELGLRQQVLESCDDQDGGGVRRRQHHWKSLDYRKVIQIQETAARYGRPPKLFGDWIRSIGANYSLR
jgi:hypothetical protein